MFLGLTISAFTIFKHFEIIVFRRFYIFGSFIYNKKEYIDLFFEKLSCFD